MAHKIFDSLEVRGTGDTINPHFRLYEGTDNALTIRIDDDSQVNFLHTGSDVGSQRVVIGGDSISVTGNSAVGIGNNAQSWGSSSTAVGNSASAQLSFTTAIGGNATAARQNSTAIGYNAQAITAGQHQTAIGYNSTASNWAHLLLVEIL